MSIKSHIIADIKSIFLFVLIFCISCKRTENRAEVKTVGVYEIKGTSAVAKGEITDLGDGVVTIGFCWNHGVIPTIDNTKVSLLSVGVVGPFFATIQGLDPVTGYLLRAYVTDYYGTTYGDLVEFTTIYDYETDTLIDIQGYKYPAVKIDTLWWMAENLRVLKLNDGTDIPLITGNTDWKTTALPAYCWPGNDFSKKEDYGLLYNWNAVNTGKLCPAHWHVSTYPEWVLIDNFLYLQTGDKLKETGTDHWPPRNSEATNSIGFTALPAGYRDGSDGHFYSLGYEGFWWTSTETSQTAARSTNISYQSGFLSGNYSSIKKNGYSVRCVKNY